MCDLRKNPNPLPESKCKSYPYIAAFANSGINIKNYLYKHKKIVDLGIISTTHGRVGSTDIHRICSLGISSAFLTNK